MKQPELGKKLNEIRNQKGITQKELSDLCSVDIRTIQRIEAGEVEPRMSTLKILAAALENDDLASKSEAVVFKDSQLKTAFFISFLGGIFYFFNFILFSLIAQKFSVLSGNGFVLAMSIIHILTGGLFFFGFIILGKQQQNKLLQVSAILILIMITLFVILDYLARGTGSSVFVYSLRILIALMGINGILFGASFLKKENQLSTLFNSANCPKPDVCNSRFASSIHWFLAGNPFKFCFAFDNLLRVT